MNKFVALVSLVAVIGIASSYPRDKSIPVPGVPVFKSMKMPKSCTNKDFCLDNTGYPFNLVEKLLGDIPSLTVANDDEYEVDFSYRSSGGDLYKEECQANSTEKPIYFIRDENEDVRVVVQLEGKFEQRSTVAWCDNEGDLANPTKHFLNSTFENVKMFCESQKMHYDFLVLSLWPELDGSYKMERASTKNGIPVCCACRYTKNFD